MSGLGKVLQADLEAMMKQYELKFLGVTEKGLRELRGQVGAEYTPGLLLAEEYLRKMREMQP